MAEYQDFAVPNDPFSACFKVEIHKDVPISIVEDFGLHGSSHDELRALISPEVWAKIATPVAAYLNKYRTSQEKEKEAKILPAKWKYGLNRVEVQRGKLLCTLLWGIENVPLSNLSDAIERWKGTDPHLLLQLYQLCKQDHQLQASRGLMGTRQALRIMIGSTL